LLSAFFEPIAIAFGVDGSAVVQCPIENGKCDNVISEYLAPFSIRLVRGENDRFSLIEP
jgi:hypothetical protein